MSKAESKQGRLEASSYFGVPIYSITVRGFSRHQPGLVDFILKLREAHPGVVRSNVNCWHSEEDLPKHDNEHIQWMVHKINNVAATAARHFHGQRRAGAPELRACWANVSESGGWNAPHQHLPADWSGVFYVQAENDSEKSENGIREGDLLFLDPLALGRRFDRPTSFGFPPKNGRMLVFPGYATHMVAPHFQKEPRISVSFNLFWNENTNSSS